MNLTKDTNAQPNAPELQNNAPSAHVYGKWAAAIAIVLVASMIPCVAILKNGMLTPAHGNTNDTTTSAAGIWGQLEYTPIVISPPVEFICDPSEEYYSQDVVWRFPQPDTFSLSALFKAINVSDPLRDKLLSMAAPDKATGGMSIYPSKQFVLNMCPEDRSALYIALRDAGTKVNQQAWFLFPGSSPDQWFSEAGISQETRKLIDPLIHRRGKFMYFSDLRTIGRLPSRIERLNLYKALLRDLTFLAHLKISPNSDIDALVKYWGRGGRDHEVRPILEAMKRKGGEQQINITHLLPPLARRALYTYPGRSDTDMAKRRRDCHWTALNFFNETPSDVFCKNGSLPRELKANYYRIGGNLRLGDLIMVVEPQGRVIHSAVYIADDILFHRCGSNSSAPWSLVRRKHLKSYYPSHKKLTIRYYRHNSM